MNLNKIFLKYCKNNKFEINNNQLDVIQYLKDYYQNNFNQSLLRKFFKKRDFKLGFYLVGDVGVDQRVGDSDVQQRLASVSVEVVHLEVALPLRAVSGRGT